MQSRTMALSFPSIRQQESVLTLLSTSRGPTVKSEAFAHPRHPLLHKLTGVQALSSTKRRHALSTPSMSPQAGILLSVSLTPVFCGTSAETVKSLRTCPFLRVRHTHTCSWLGQMEPAFARFQRRRFTRRVSRTWL